MNVDSVKFNFDVWVKLIQDSLIPTVVLGISICFNVSLELKLYNPSQTVVSSTNMLKFCPAEGPQTQKSQAKHICMPQVISIRKHLLTKPCVSYEATKMCL